MRQTVSEGLAAFVRWLCKDSLCPFVPCVVVLGLTEPYSAPYLICGVVTVNSTTAGEYR